MKYFVVEQIPALTSELLRMNCQFLACQPREWLADRALELCYTNHELKSFAADLGRDHPPFRWQPDRRVLLQAEIDAAVIHLYGLNRTQAEWLLDSFTVLQKYEERDHGEFGQNGLCWKSMTILHRQDMQACLSHSFEPCSG